MNQPKESDSLEDSSLVMVSKLLLKKQAQKEISLKKRHDRPRKSMNNEQEPLMHQKRKECLWI